MKKNSEVILTILCIFTASCSDYGKNRSDAEYELQNKREYSLIESEYYSMEKSDVKGVVIRKSKFDSQYKVALIELKGGNYKFTVLLLNPKYPPYKKSFPVKNFQIPKDVSKQIKIPSQ